MIVLDVLGTPAPKGSGRAMLIGGKARHIASGSTANQRAIKSWDVAVRCEAATWIARNVSGTHSDRAQPWFSDRPLAVSIVFRMRAPKKPRAAPMTKPDIDKLARATLDALHGSIFDDDSRVVELALVKVYATPGREGARVVIKEWQAP